MNAIPTVYSGVQFRSRLEAETAQLLDVVGMRWRYECNSFLLPSGLHYRPDFFVPETRTWLEVRGYDTDTGNAQLTGFAEEVRYGRVRGGFAALSLERFRWACPEDSGCDAVLLKYSRCGRWTVGPESTLRCGVCRSCDNRQFVWDVVIVNGHVRVADAGSPFMTPVEFAQGLAVKAKEVVH